MYEKKNEFFAILHYVQFTPKIPTRTRYNAYKTHPSFWYIKFGIFSLVKNLMKSYPHKNAPPFCYLFGAKIVRLVCGLL